MGSDHLPICTTIFSQNSKNEEKIDREKFKFEKADWPQFRELCREVGLDDVYSEDINTFNQNLCETFLNIAKKCIPVSKSNKKKGKNVPWWDSSCAESIQGRKKALNALKKHPSADNIQKYRDAEAQATTTILNGKRKNWEEFCDSCVHKSTNSKDFWQKIHRIKGNANRPIPLLKFKSSLATNDTDKAQFLVRHYAKVASDSNVPPETLAYQRNFESLHKNYIDTPELEATPLNCGFSLTELNEIISTRKDSAAGLDGVSYLLFKHMPSSALNLWLIYIIRCGALVSTQ